MGLKNCGFYMDINKAVVDLTKDNVTSLQRINNEIYFCQAFGIWRLLRSKIVRGSWKDHKGYPLKECYYNNNKLACSVSIRHLCEMTGMHTQSVQKYLKKLVDAGWIEISNDYTSKKQNVYVLGYWTAEIIKDETVYKEFLLKDKAEDPNGKIKLDKIGRKTLDLDAIYGDDLEVVFAQP